VGQTQEELLIIDCTAEVTACIRDARSIRALTTCNRDYAQCLAGQPQEILDAVDGVTACAEDAVSCVEAAQTPSDLVACSEGRVTCVGDALGVPLPEPVAAVQCAEEATSCVVDASSIAELTQCAEDLSACTLDFADDLVGALPLPPEVGTAIRAVTDCAQSLESCVFDARSPEDLLACQDEQATCIADAIGVDIPSVSDALTCTEDAAQCVLDARSIADLQDCTSGLTSGLAVGLPQTGVPIIDCSTQFTQCVASNPFNILQCADQARQCNFR
jgi:hypothetical protein